MRILYAASEANPFAKSGGLADVAGALPKALVKDGVDARVIMPLYGDLKHREMLEYVTNYSVPVGWRSQYCGLFKGQLSWGHCLKIYDPEEQQELGTVKEEILTWLPKFELYEGETCIGTLKKELTFFKPKYNIDFNGWHVEGDVFEWDYTITGPDGGTVAAVSKEPFRWTDTYVLDITDPKDALYVLMFVLAIDAEKCSRN